MKSIQRLAFAFGTASLLVACASAAPAPQIGGVTTTSASVGEGQCRTEHSQCYRDGECCSGSCDYDLYFCH